MSRVLGEPSSQDRLEYLLTLLDQDWHSYTTLEELTGRLERTLRRDIQRLEAQGYPIETRRQSMVKQFRLKPGTRKQPIEPGILEVIAVNLGRGLLGFLQGTELRDEMEGLFQALRSSSRASERQLKDLDRKFWFMPDAPRDYQGCDEQLNDLITCLLDQRIAVLSYRGRQQPAEVVRLRPYTLIVRRECLYVLGVVEQPDGGFQAGVRLFDLTRIESCQRLRETFDLPDEWDPAQVFRESFGVFIPREGEAPATRVLLSFDGGVGKTIQRRRWHESQQWSQASDGRCLLEMQLRICPELVHWLVSFGPKVRVRLPLELREAVLREHREALEAYAD